MAIKIKDAGTLRTIKKGYVKVGGVLRPIKRVLVNDNGTVRTVAVFADPLTVTASNVSGTGNGSTGATAVTNTTTAAPAGGTAPYTYAWTLLTNGGGTASYATNPSSATTAFVKTGMAQSTSFTDTWRVTVTDANGETATAGVFAVFSNGSTGGPVE